MLTSVPGPINPSSSTAALGRQVGGTNPSLLCAAGGATSVVVIDVESLREVVWGDCGYFGGPGTRGQPVDVIQRGSPQRPYTGQRLQRRASELAPNSFGASIALGGY